MGFDYINKMPTPSETKQQFPLPKSLREQKRVRDDTIKKILRGEDNRFIVIIGPCSADNETSVLDYVTRLAKVADETKDQLFIVPRIYTSKPRTTGSGYKGLLHQPDSEKMSDMYAGYLAVRRLHMNVIKETGLTTADELLYPEAYEYISDLLCYMAIGARSVENQQHRLTASGLDIPCGMKNPTGGDLSVMMNAITAAQNSHHFDFRGWEVVSEGNPYAHALMRGYTDISGKSVPNYHYEDIRILSDLYAKSGLQNPSVIIDANHANSGKKYLEQVRICREVLLNRQYSDDLKKLIKGVMIESYIEDGNQKVGGGKYGCSITDPCLGWEKTQALLYEMAEKI
ncbi:MAG: 3-deoxy-7-phosphoheptulonate synthase [Clostridia bacterium]|nr:3-deoxy-7-phosphoheptulonate synthase [Clostridia bacterium]